MKGVRRKREKRRGEGRRRGRKERRKVNYLYRSNKREKE